ncbi:fimbrial protein [Salmonella enterica]|nr:fimbrial protein [Salmonella enterica]
MTERLFNMKVLILSGAFMLLAACDSAQANIDSSYCNADGHISLQNINLKGGDYVAGQELQSVTIPISYICYTTRKTYGPNYYTTLNIFNLRQTVTALQSIYLGMDITVQENGGGAPVTFTWAEIQAGASGWGNSKVFGQYMEQNQEYIRSGNLTFRIFVNRAFKNTFSNINIPSSTINILPYNPDGISPPIVPFKPLTVSAFNLRFIPESSGRVIVSPSVINLGHFYTEYKDTMVAREAAFTVTAQQNIGTQTPFVTPLAIEFKTNGLTLADADTSVTLKNTKGEANGFRLSVMDETGATVKFNTKTEMGSINLDNASGGKIIKQYKAKVEPIPGSEIKTGSFSAAMTVVVTYI